MHMADVTADLVDWTELGIQLVAKRVAVGLSRRAVARRLGVTSPTIKSIEEGRGAQSRAQLVLGYARLVAHPLYYAAPRVPED